MKFESNDIIRFMTKDNRDILYRFNENDRKAKYLGECKVQGLFNQKVQDDKNAIRSRAKKQTTFDFFLQRNH